MKKGMMFLAVLLCGSLAFAQGYIYEDEAYAKTAAQLEQNPMPQLNGYPSGFYFDEQNVGFEDTYNDRRNLFYLAKDKYLNHPRSFNAVYNYGLALLSEEKTDDIYSLPANNAYEGRKVIKQAIDLNPKSVESYQLLDRALEYILFDNERSYGGYDNPYHKNYDVKSIRVYIEHPQRAQERLEAFEKRVELKDETLTAANYHEADLMCRALQLNEKAEYYRQIEQEKIHPLGERHGAMLQWIVVREMQFNFKPEPPTTKLTPTDTAKTKADDLYGAMVDNMNRGMK